MTLLRALAGRTDQMPQVANLLYPYVIRLIEEVEINNNCMKTRQNLEYIQFVLRREQQLL